MPTLKQIKCSIELGPSNTKLKEYGTRYSDGHVEAFVAVPDTDIPFTIHLKSEGYIAPGLAFFVFIDGDYQCNRNRICLKLPGEGVQPRDFVTEFRLRQKEEKTSFGTFVVRDWTFAKLNRVAADKAPSLNPQFVNNVGSIEIIALRCKTDMDEVPPAKRAVGSSKQKPAMRAPSATTKPAAKAESRPPSEHNGDMMMGLFDGACDAMNLDGAGDERPVGRNGRVNPEPPPGMAFDSKLGMFRPVSDPCYHGRRDSSSETYQHARTVEGGHAQLDGYEGPGVVINQWGNRGRDDMRGDKYLGMEGDPKQQYKRYLAAKGKYVSEFNHGLPANDAGPPYVQRLVDSVNGRLKYAPNTDGRQQRRRDIYNLDDLIKDFEQANPNANSGEAYQQLQQLKMLRQQLGDPDEQDHKVGHTPGQRVEPRYPMQAQYCQQPAMDRNQDQMRFENLPMLLQEKLLDIEEMRKDMQQHLRQFPRHDLSFLGRTLANKQLEAANDIRMQRKPISHTLEDLELYYDLLDEREEDLKGFIDAAKQSSGRSGYTPAVAEQRLRFVHDLAEDVYKDIEGLGGPKASPQGSEVHVQGSYRADHGPHGGDATPGGNWNANVNPSARTNWQNQGGQLGNQPGFQPMGTGVWNANPPWQMDQNKHQPANNQGWQKPQSQHNGANGGWSQGAAQTPAPYGNNANGNGDQQNSWGAQPVQGSASQQRQASQHGSQHNGGWGANGGDAQQSGGWGNAGGNDAGTNNWRGDQAPAASVKEDQQRSAASGSYKSGSKGLGGTSASKKGDGCDWNAPAASNKKGNGGWGAPAGSNKEGDGDWGAPAGSKKASDNGWDQGSQRTKRGGSRAANAQSQDADPKAYIKPYWKDWNQPLNTGNASDSNRKKKRDEPREVYNYPAVPIQSMPADKAKEVSHGVQVGRGADYSHMTRKPTYIDTMEFPYAVFSFKYRSKEALGNILKLKVDDVEVDMKKIKEQAEMDNYMTMPKHKLIEELMDKRGPQKGTADAKGSNAGSRKGGSNWSGKPASNAGGGNAWASNDNGQINGAGDTWGGGANDDNGAGDGWGGGANDNNGAGDGWGGDGNNDNKGAGDDWGGGVNDNNGAGDGWAGGGNDDKGSRTKSRGQRSQKGDASGWAGANDGWKADQTPVADRWGSNDNVHGEWGQAATPAANGAWDSQNKADHDNGAADWANDQNDRQNNSNSSKTHEHFSEGGLCDTSEYFREGAPGHGRKPKSRIGMNGVDAVMGPNFKWETIPGISDAGNMAKYAKKGDANMW